MRNRTELVVHRESAIQGCMPEPSKSRDKRLKPRRRAKTTSGTVSARLYSGEPWHAEVLVDCVRCLKGLGPGDASSDFVSQEEPPIHGVHSMAVRQRLRCGYISFHSRRHFLMEAMRWGVFVSGNSLKTTCLYRRRHSIRSAFGNRRTRDPRCSRPGPRRGRRNHARIRSRRST